MTLAAAGGPGGLTGALLDLIDTLGPIGVGLTVLLEVIVPPIPSEVLLPAAGYLVQTGRLGLVAVFVAATVGSVVGAACFYLLGQMLGPDRSRRALSRLPGVSAEDIDKTFAWFARHGRGAVLLGRLVPVIRSFVSVPAGVVRMPWPQFLLYTALGSGLWNAALIAGGMLLGTQYRLVERYAGWLNYGLVAAVVIAVGLLLARAVRRRARE